MRFDFLSVQRRLRRNSTRYVEGGLRGTVICGSAATGKTFLLQSRAVEALRLGDGTFLTYVGPDGRCEPLTEALPGPFVKAERNYCTDRLTYEGDNVFAGIYGRQWAGEGKAAVHMTLLRALEERGKYILAVDEPLYFFPSPEERDELFSLIKRLVDAPVPQLALLMTFRSITQIRDCFGEEGVALLARLHEKFVLSNHESENELLIGAGMDVSEVVADVSMLHKGEAIHVVDGLARVVTFGLDRKGGPTGKKGLRGAWYLRRRHLRSAIRPRRLSWQPSSST
jgi:hypothetical protein